MVKEKQTAKLSNPKLFVIYGRQLVKLIWVDDDAMRLLKFYAKSHKT